MGMLSTLFREKVSKIKDPRMSRETEPDYQYPTGFLSFDYMNGVVVHVKKEDMQFTYNSVGIVDGSLVMVIGRSGCGKTTWCVQSAGNIVRPFEQSAVYMDSLEGGIVDTRASQLLKMSGEQMKERFIPRNTGITAENFYERIKIIHDIKLEHRDEFEYDTGTLSPTGEKIYKLAPTVYILDSLALLTPDKYSEEDELSGQMSTTAAAKTNTQVFKRMVPLLKAANIIVFVINHITEKVEISAFSKSQGQLSYLKPDERIGGGRAAIYVSNLLVRMDDHSKMKEDEGFGIDGILVDLTLLKSRTSHAGNKVTLVFNYESGFDPELSLLYFLKSEKLVNGAGAYLYFGDRSDLKFSQKQFKQKLKESEEFRQAFVDTIMPALQKLINDNGDEDFYKDNTYDITTQILETAKAA